VSDCEELVGPPDCTQ